MQRSSVLAAVGQFQRKYDDDQRAAILYAGCDATPRLSSAQVVEQAALGQLVTPDGKTVPAFKCAKATVVDYVRKEKRRREDARPKRAADYDDPDVRARAASRDAWALVDKDLRSLREMGVRDRGENNRVGAVVPEKVEARQRALERVVKNMAALKRVGTDQAKAEPAPQQAAEPERSDPTAELTRAARTEPPKLTEARAPVSLPDRLAGRGPLPPVQALSAE